MTEEWVHGNAFQNERTTTDLVSVPDGFGRVPAYTDVIGLAQGWGKTFRFRDWYVVDNWFHVSIPTSHSAGVGGPHPVLREFSVLFATSDGLIEINQIDVWDCSTRVFTWIPPIGEAPRSGSHLTVDRVNTFTPPAPIGIPRALSLSVHVRSFSGTERQIVFTGARAVFG